MKKLLLILLVACSFIAKAQVHNNEWIDYTKTYYKFKVGKTGLYRIPQPALAAIGLANIPAEGFQLWRNGTQVPIYTSVSSGVFTSADYIEFWGYMNDGKPDKALYRKPEYQLNDKWSLETDTATYFLTVNTTTPNLRLVTAPNNIAGNTLAAEPYFIYTAGIYFRDKINAGYAVNVGEYIYSSSYDMGEGWTSNDIGTGTTQTTTLSNLYVYNGGPAPSFRIAVSGNASNQRTYKAAINNDSITGNVVDSFNTRVDSVTFSLSTIASNTASVQVTNSSVLPNDRLVVHQFEINYPRQFNFGGSSNFEFSLPGSAAGKYLEISGFSYGTSLPVLYDITNGRRYLMDVSAAPLLKVVLQPSAVTRKLILVSEEDANVTAVAALQARTFTNYSSVNNQSDYLIISNALLQNSATGTNPVEDYRTYRSSAAGGGFNAKIFLVDDLTDQFGFGIKKNPLAIRNFINFSRLKFSITPKHVFLIGKGVTYNQQRAYESSPDMDKLNLVPTFGWPASDALLTAIPGSSVPEIPVGRLSVIYPDEVTTYLKKIIEYEQAQKTGSPYIKDKAWTKNVVHVVGSNDPTLQSTLDAYMNTYKQIISDTLFGANVNTFSKTSAEEVQQLSNMRLQALFNEGISLITYFGHSSSSSLAFNLNSPEDYNNKGKYPMFIALGCDAGDFFNFNTIRFQTKETLSEKFVLAQDRGTIGFVASTSLGIIYYLDILNTRFYQALSSTHYGKPVAEALKTAIAETLNFTSEEDFDSRATVEQIALDGDPAILLNTHAKPDYVIEDSLVKITPTLVSVADAKITVKAKMFNIGKAINKNIVVQITRTYPNNISEVVYRDTIVGIRYADSISVDLPINSVRDKGTNKLSITVDADNAVDELYETNNTVTKDFFVYENEARPVYPYNYSIVSNPAVKLVASTANAFAKSAGYKMEIDTTELFNSSSKKLLSITSAGGILEFSPGVVYKDNTVYYWHVGMVSDSGTVNWSVPFSFVYISNHAPGFNQSHTYQFLKSTNTDIVVDPVSGVFRFAPAPNDLLIRNAVYPASGTSDNEFMIFINSPASYIAGGCYYNELIFNVLDSLTFNPWKNNYANGTGLYNSLVSSCATRRGYNFEYSLASSDSRKKAMDFIDSIPIGDYVIVRTNTYPWDPNANTYSSAWKTDTAIFGANNSLYNKFQQQGFSSIDSFNHPRAFIFVFRKGMGNTFTPKIEFSQGIYDKIDMSLNITTTGRKGTSTSPIFGPAKAWKEFQWSGNSIDAGEGDVANVNIIGIQQDGVTTNVLYSGITPDKTTFDISSVNANTYPYLQLQLNDKDSIYHTPYQLKYWRLTYDPVPEGALAPNVYLSMKDTLGLGENLNFKVAFKNVSPTPFDSLKVKVVLTNSNNVATVLQQRKYKPLQANDTLQVVQPISSAALHGINTLYVEVNPDNDQPEQYHFNNFGYKTFYVIGDSINPLMDVTFDNTHILNHDIVSSKPDIVIKLKDESKFLLLDDTSLINVRVRYPDGSIHAFRFNSDTLQFVGAKNGNDNTATISFKPYFSQDGNYELLVSGKDKSNNQAGNNEYRVGFQVINKAMISNMLNYPNPFTTSTAFVFTITGSEVPQNIRIQILTITGKIVRDITKEELGPLHIGRNITEFKWDGTDGFGQKVANGIYLYRVITNLNGKALEKYKSDSDNTDKYFTKGYGKMYLMR